jgi:membrane-associated phospholipid phosphatase
MLFFRNFRFHLCQPVTVALLGVWGSTGWASNHEIQKPCIRQTDSHSAELPRSDSAERNRKREKDAAANFCRAHFEHSFASDQKTIWTSPLHLHTQDANWLVPLGVGTLGVLAADHAVMRHFATTPVSHSNGFGNYGLASIAGSVAILYLRGTITSNDHSRETGLLAGEAAMNSVIVGEAMKLVFERPRPNAANAGSFGTGGASFPSEHALAAWSIASVMAHEYPGPLTKLLVYGAASGISLSRITAREHFPSDVVVGGGLGYLIGRYVYQAHHDPDLPGASENVFEDKEPQRARSSAEHGSPYVPLDSWVYPALGRLAALGYVQTAYLGIRPWTRMECARLLEEAAETIGDGTVENHEANQLYSALAGEFAGESARSDGAANFDASLDSVYSGVTGISGTPLRDGYHFGQTTINNYGRPYGEGFNAIDGFSSHAVAGPLSFTIRGEYQHAPAVISDAPGVLQATATADGTLPLANGTAPVNRFTVLESTIGLTFKTVQLSFGQQSLWLGPSEAGSFLFSNNAQPVTMLRIDSVSPYRIPLLSYLLGPVRSQFFLGRLSGQRWEASPTLFGPNLTSQPFVHGTSVSFHPTANLEFGFGFTAQFGGQGNPFTWSNFLRTFYSHRADPSANPAKRLSEFNFNYRVPRLRDWLQAYVDSMVIDEYSPIGSTRPAISPGLYLPRLPKMHKMELRIEGITTDLNYPQHFGPGAFYTDGRYRSGYTNNGNLIGDWIGRQGRGEQGWLTYRFSSRTFIQTEYRHNSVDKEFLSGGQVRDLTLRADVMLTQEWSVSGYVQQENWHFPVLFPTAKSDVAASLQLTFWPHWKTGKSNHTSPASTIIVTPKMTQK